MSGKAVLEALQRADIDAHAFDPAARDIAEIRSFNRAFIVLHGRGGEDGTMQGALETLDVPYTGSGVMASALCLDKWRTKLVWQSTGIPTPRHVLVETDTDPDALPATLGLPLIIKPVHEGSTIGLSRVQRRQELAAALATARRHDPMVLAEECIIGQELTTAILGDQALPLVRIEAPAGRYDYHAKYFSDETRYHCPAGIDARLEAEIQAAALKAFRVLGCRGWGRADVMLRPSGEFFFLEMNTVPGMTGHSLVPMAARAAGMSFDDLVLAILRPTLPFVEQPPMEKITC